VQGGSIKRWENWWPRLLLAQLLCRRWPSQNVAVVVLFNGFDNRVAMEAATFCLDGRDKTPEIFERMKRTLARIAQYVLLLAMGEGNADQPMDGRADEANDVVLIGEDANHLGPPLDLAVEALDGVWRRAAWFDAAAGRSCRRAHRSRPHRESQPAWATWDEAGQRTCATALLQPRHRPGQTRWQ